MKKTDTEMTLRMLRRLLETEANAPVKGMPDPLTTEAQNYLTGRREGIYVAINAITDTLDDRS